MAVRAVLGQQLTFIDPKSVITRLVRTFGRPLRTSQPGLTHLFPRAEVLAEANLSSMGIPPARADTLRALARAAADGNPGGYAYKSLEELISRLCVIRGLETRQAHYIAQRAFGEPDAFPSADRGLRQVPLTGQAKLSESEFLSIADRWRPWRAYAAMHLWASATIR
ncbi:MAG: DNA-3-methyladenine glycosylase family protein [Gammaproteobacteria bacterium]